MLTKPTITDNEIISRHTPSVKARARIELAICRRLLHDLDAAGYKIGIDDGDGTEAQTSTDEALRLLFNLDDVTIRTRKDGKDSFIWLVFGNDGYDLICDYGTSMETVMEPLFTWIKNAQESGACPVVDWEVANLENR